MKKSELQIQLELIAKLQASSLGWKFTSACFNHHLKPFIKAGVQNMYTKGQLDDPEWLELAKTNTKSLVIQMAIEAKKQNLKQLEERSFKPLLISICPFFPFC